VSGTDDDPGDRGYDPEASWAADDVYAMASEERDEETAYDLAAEQQRLERKVLGAVGVGIIVAMAGVGLAIWVFFLWNRADDASADAEGTREGLEAVSSGLDTLRVQIEMLGEEPVVPPAEEIVEDVETGGDPVMIPGPQGEPGEPGQAPAPAEIQRAVNNYCALQPGGSCEGPEGPIGPAGAAGAAGEAGAAGPGPTDEQVVAAILAFCGDGGCVGPIGPAGPEGPAGAQGPAGPAGPAGPSCPDGYSLVTIPIPSQPESEFLVCSRPTQ
jgi:hypothetical protein